MPIGTNSFVLVKNCFDVSIYQYTPHDLALTPSFWYKTKFRHNFTFAFFFGFTAVNYWIEPRRGGKDIE